MASHHDTAKRWAEVVGTDNPRYLNGHNVWVRGDRIYSYGMHFELGRLIGSRDSGFFLLNGDRYSVTTSRHQADVRGAVASTGLPSAIIPYSALAAAGIVLDSIRPLDVLPDRTDEHHHRVNVPGLLDLAERAKAGSFGWNESGGYNGVTGAVSATGRMVGPDGVEYSATVYRRAWDHSAGGFADHEPCTSFYRNGGGLVHVEGDTFEYSTWTHFLGACLFTARVTGRKTRARFLSAFDENERQPLYFLAELPRCNARTYAEALDALAPRIVHAALAQGRDVKRQGDIFAIPTELDRRALRKRGAAFASRSGRTYTAGPGGLLSDARLLGSNHEATEVAQVGRAVYARGCLYHSPGAWRDPDHARVKLGDGKTWHLIARNTVPQTRAASRAGAGRL